MSDIKIEVGQAWRGNRTGTIAMVVAGIDGFKYALALPAGPVAIRDEGVIQQNWTLVSAPTQARIGCKAWCGHLISEDCVPWSNGRYEVLDRNGGKPIGGHRFDGYLPNQPAMAWCTALCRDERRPPLPASSVAKTAVILCQDCEQPMKFIGKGLYECRCDVKSVQPKEAAAPKCIECGSQGTTVIERVMTKLGRRNFTCESCMMFMEYCFTGAGPGLAKSSLPERLPKPRLAHVAGAHDEDLLGVQ